MISYQIGLDCIVTIPELVRGAEKVQVVRTNSVAPWEQPLLRFKIPPGSRPGDIIKIRKGWTSDDEFLGFDVLVTLRLYKHTATVIDKDDVYFKISVKTNWRHKVGKIRIAFPDGEVRDVWVDRVVKEPMVLRFSGRGFPRRRDDIYTEHGDYYVIIQPITKKCWIHHLVSKMFGGGI